MEIKLIVEGTMLSSRFTGQNYRDLVVASLKNNEEIILNFDGVNLATQSFCDELFGKLFADLDKKLILKHLKVINANDSIASIIKYSIANRKSLCLS